MSSGHAGYYLGLAREDYYLSGGEPPGRWHGQGANSLGLTGEVDADDLYNLFDGLYPNGTASLIQRQDHSGKSEHRPGWDLTFSAPKSVSVLWSQCGDQLRSAIQGVQARAVTAALDYLEDTSTFTRRGEGGRDFESVGLVCAMFEHSTSRALDPQLHTHALVMNLSIRDDGTTGTLSSLDLFLSKMSAGALYRAELAKGLQVDLGLHLHRDGSWFELTDVPRDLMQSFSKRREAIENELAKSGMNSAEAASVVAIQTRQAKGDVSRLDLLDSWKGEGLRHGWSNDKAERLFGTYFADRDSSHEIATACANATDRLTWAEAFFSERDFIRYLAEESQGRGFGADDVRRGAAAFLADSPEIVRLGVVRSEERFTTKKMLDLERELLSAADELAKSNDTQLHAPVVMATISKFSELSAEQIKAVWHITADSGGLAVVSGMAGTGKTKMLDAAREAWEAEGYQVQGAALPSRAGRELESGARIPSDTIAKRLLDLERGVEILDSKTILVIDEAGMVATPDMRKLVIACRDAGSKLVLVGDERQLQPIGPGAPFRELGKRHGMAELSDIRRQNEEWARQAVKDMASGDARNALRAFAERGFVNVSETREDAMRELIAQWRTGDGRPEDSLILAGTRAEAAILNRLAQSARQLAGELLEPHTGHEEEWFFQNDRVMFTKNRRTLGIDNGTRGTIQNISEDGEQMTVRLDSGERVSLQTHDCPDLTLGYASTTHKAQGATTQRAYVLGGGTMQGRELSYVQTSRARLETWIFATTSESGDDISTLAREMGRGRQKEMAHAHLADRPLEMDRDIDVGL